jgi:hypothetical protein
MSKELIDLLKSYIPSGDGHNSQYANDLADAVAILESKAAPVAYITGQFAGRCVIEAINRAAVLPTGMALYTAPQPSAVQGVNAQLLEALESAADALARAEFFEQADNARAAISAVREEVMK